MKARIDDMKVENGVFIFDEEDDDEVFDSEYTWAILDGVAPDDYDEIIRRYYDALRIRQECNKRFNEEQEEIRIRNEELEEEERLLQEEEERLIAIEMEEQEREERRRREEEEAMDDDDIFIYYADEYGYDY